MIPFRMRNSTHLLKRLFVMCLVCVRLAAEQGSTTLQQEVRAYRVAHQKQIIAELVKLLSVPNRAADSQDIERNADAIKSMLARRGISVQLLRVPGAPPLVLGEMRTQGAKATIGVYAHYDGQPVDSAQ